MKCEYCNRRNDSQAQTCAGCGAPFCESVPAPKRNSEPSSYEYYCEIAKRNGQIYLVPEWAHEHVLENRRKTAAVETEYASDDMYLVPKEHHKRLIKSAMLAQINRNPKISIEAENNANAALSALRYEIRAKAKEGRALAKALAGSIIIVAVVIAIIVIARLIY